MSAQNAGRGFTTMENALVDLMGVPIKSEAWAGSNAPTDENSFIEVGPFAAGNMNNIRLDLIAMGSDSGPGYLSLKAENFFAVEGQAGDIDEDRDDGTVKGMPDVVDAFGEPLMMWVRDQAGPAIGNDSGSVDRFAQIHSNGDRAHYYWASNSGYLGAERLGRDPADRLDECYRFLRVLEHRMQLHRLRRTHVIPTAEADLRRLARG